MSNAAAPATDGPDRSDGPLHVAVIMDGNGRWAAARGLPRVEGHRRGVEALRRVVRAANELGILYLTIFSFSSENWSRPATEIGDLFGLLRRFIRNDLATLHRDGVRVRVIGERDGLEPDICALLKEAEDLTRDNRRLNLVVAFNYGSRQEIAGAALWRSGRENRIVTEGEAAPGAVAGQGSRNLLMRIIAGAVLAPVAIAIAYAGGWLWTSLVTIAAIGLYVEWLTIVGAAREARVVASGAVALAIAGCCLALGRIDRALPS